MAQLRLDQRTVTTLVAEATTAPSMHNAQPWRFRFLAAERLVLLRADPARAMPRSDPGNRALHIGCGAD
ncbi:nitroreductase, partial [Streptomyces venezuelae]